MRDSIDVVEQCHKAKIHMQLLMAMKQRESRIVCGEVDFHFLVAAYHDHVLHDAGQRFSRNLGEFEAVPVQMDWMDVVAGIPHPQAVALTLAEMVGGDH